MPMHPHRSARRWFGLIVLCAGMLGSAGQSRAVTNEPNQLKIARYIATFLGSDEYERLYVDGTLAVGDDLYIRTSVPDGYGGYNGQLSRTDGTASGTIGLDSYGGEADRYGTYIHTLRYADDRVYFLKNSWCNNPYDENCYDAYDTLGYTTATMTTTEYIKEFTGTTNSLIEINNTLLFDNNNDLWISDGTTTGTLILKDFEGIERLVVAGDVVYFAGNDGVHGTELWRSDGTEPGTTMVTDSMSGSADSNLTSLTASGDYVYFTTTPTTDMLQLWRSDGTEDGTIELTQFAVADDSYPRLEHTTDVSGTLYFIANNTELWRSNGTADTTLKVQDFGSDVAYVPSFTATDGVLYFIIERTTGRELWRSDGSSNGTLLLKALGDCQGLYLYPHPVASYQGLVYFSACSGADAGLWYTDGTDSGTIRVSALVPIHLVATNSRLYFFANDDVHGNALWELVDVTDVVYLPMIQR